jgi:YfiH family protein
MTSRGDPLGRWFDHLGPGVRAVVTTRGGGASTGPYASLNLGYHVGDDPGAVASNRERVCRWLGVEQLTVADNAHGAAVAVITPDLAGAGHGSDEDGRRRLGGIDGLVTDQPGVALMVLVADCQPIVLWDPVRRALGVAHAGRGGTVQGIVPAVVGQLASSFGSRPADLRVGIGPHIGPRSYEVGRAEVDEFVATFGSDLVHPTTAGRGSLDLEGAVRRQLAGLGVPEPAVAAFGVDTRTSTDEWFSDRAERPCGRFGLVAVIDPPEA